MPRFTHFKTIAVPNKQEKALYTAVYKGNSDQLAEMIDILTPTMASTALVYTLTGFCKEKKPTSLADTIGIAMVLQHCGAATTEKYQRITINSETLGIPEASTRVIQKLESAIKTAIVAKDSTAIQDLLEHAPYFSNMLDAFGSKTHMNFLSLFQFAMDHGDKYTAGHIANRTPSIQAAPAVVSFRTAMMSPENRVYATNEHRYVDNIGATVLELTTQLGIVPTPILEIGPGVLEEHGYSPEFRSIYDALNQPSDTPKQLTVIDNDPRAITALKNDQTRSGSETLQVTLSEADALAFCMQGSPKWKVVIANKSLMYALNQHQEEDTSISLDTYVTQTFDIGPKGALLITDKNTFSMLFGAKTFVTDTLGSHTTTDRYQYHVHQLNQATLGPNTLFGVHITHMGELT